MRIERRYVIYDPLQGASQTYAYCQQTNPIGARHLFWGMYPDRAMLLTFTEAILAIAECPYCCGLAERGIFEIRLISFDEL